MKKNYTFKILLLLMLFIGVNINAQVRIVKVDPANNQVTLRNYGGTAVDISNYWLCNFPDYKQDMSAVTSLAAGTSIIINATVTMNTSEGEMGLYSNTSFGSSVSMLDYMEWGFGGHTRESVAVAKGIWGAGDFVNTAAPYGYLGDGAQNGVSFWGTTLSNLEFNATTKFSVFPNPTSNVINIDIAVLIEGLKVEVYDILGKRVYADSLSTLSTSIDISQWNSGMFLVKLSSAEDNISLTKRFVKM